MESMKQDARELIARINSYMNYLNKSIQTNSKRTQ